jgi:hypothetical protein
MRAITVTTFLADCGRHRRQRQPYCSPGACLDGRVGGDGRVASPMIGD